MTADLNFFQNAGKSVPAKALEKKKEIKCRPTNCISSISFFLLSLFHLLLRHAMGTIFHLLVAWRLTG
jgi:hypothetical protein